MWLLLVLMGGHALCGQLLLMRELLVVLSGHELCLGIIFAAWLSGIFAGAWLGGRIQSKVRRPLTFFLWAQTAAVLMAPILVIAIRLVRLWIQSMPGVPIPLIPTFLASAAGVAPLSILVGFLFPLACKVVSNHSHQAARSIGGVYVLEAFGSLLAGGVLTYVLLARMDAFNILFLWGMMILPVEVGLALRSRTRIAVPLAGLTFLWGFAWIWGAPDMLHRISVQARWKAAFPGITHLASRDSRYQSVEIGRMDSQYSVFGNGHLLSSFPDPHAAAFPVHLVMNQRPQPRSVLVLGGGPGSLLPLLLRYPVERIQVVELDPLVYELSRPYLPTDVREAMKDPRVQWAFTDGRYWVRKCPSGSFDVLLLQVPDPSTALLNRFHTVEFYRDVRRILKPGGMILTSVTGSVNYIGGEIRGYLGSIYCSLKKVFHEIQVIPGDRALLIGSAKRGIITVDPQQLSEIYRAQGIQDESFPAEAFFFWIQRDRVEMWGQALAQHKGRANHDSLPVAFVQYLALLDLMSARKFGRSPFRHLEKITFPWILACWAGLYLAIVWSQRKNPLRGLPLIAIAVTGCTAMAQEILCLYMYQAMRGYLYSRLGLIVALFMAGLASGGWIGMRCSPGDAKKMLVSLLGVQAGMVILCAGIPLGWVPAFFREGSLDLPGGLIEIIVGLWMVLAGAGTGVTFPLACGLRSRTETRVGTVAGQIDAADHLGAAIGALLAGAFLVPMLGLSRTGVFLAAMQGSVFLFVAICIFHPKARV